MQTFDFAIFSVPSRTTQAFIVGTFFSKSTSSSILTHGRILFVTLICCLINQSIKKKWCVACWAKGLFLVLDNKKVFCGRRLDNWKLLRATCLRTKYFERIFVVKKKISVFYTFKIFLCLTKGWCCECI